MTCTSGHRVSAGSIVDSAQGPRCPHCGGLCAERSPADVLPATYLNEIRASTWTEIGRRTYIIGVERGDFSADQEFDLGAISLCFGSLSIALRPAEIDAIQHGYNAEKWAAQDDDHVAEF